MMIVMLYLWTEDREKLDVSVSAGDLLQLDGTLDESVLIGDKYIMAPPRTKRYFCLSFTFEDKNISFLLVT